MTDAIEGGCRCGAVRYTVKADKLPNTYACHCLDCQTWSGSAFSLQFIVPEDALDGEPASRISMSARLQPTKAANAHLASARLRQMHHPRLQHQHAPPRLRRGPRRHARRQRRTLDRRAHLDQAETEGHRHPARVAELARGRPSDGVRRCVDALGRWVCASRRRLLLPFGELVPACHCAERRACRVRRIDARAIRRIGRRCARHPSVRSRQTSSAPNAVSDAGRSTRTAGPSRS